MPVRHGSAPGALDAPGNRVAQNIHLYGRGRNLMHTCPPMRATAAARRMDKRYRHCGQSGE